VLFTSGQYHAAMPEELPYIASKGALHHLTPSLAAHLMPRGITVNCIDPGPNDTGYATAGEWTHGTRKNPGRGRASVRDAGAAVLWAASAAGSDRVAACTTRVQTI
jgi:3-oxoacyl-[acyl-carrier protein] reductase